MRGIRYGRGQFITSLAGALMFGFMFANPAAAVPLNSALYQESFDSLANSGSTGTLLPTDWAISEVPTSSPLSYGVSTGSATAGNTYSFGAAGATDRALGGQQSGSLVPSFGVHFENGGSTPLISLTISYTGEQWRLGASGRTDRLDFQFSLNATSLATGTWLDVDGLDFSTPNTAVTGAHDGNLAANQSSISSTITGLSLAVGDSLWLRWTDFNSAGADDGLAVDDFSVSAAFATPPPPAPSTSVPDAGSSLALLGLSLSGLGLLARRRPLARSSSR